MNIYKLKKLYLTNFKLFDEKIIDFNESNLLMLDGPNGYGKTSVFEGLEFLLTGTIKRISNSAEVDGKQAYDTHALAKDSSKIIEVKGEFISDSKEILKVIRSINCQKLKGKKNNPKELEKNSTLEVYCGNEVKRGNYKNKEADEYLKSKLGKQIIDNYSNACYISQENRLGFLSQSETGRMNQIRNLFNMKNEVEERNKYRLLYNKINTIYSKKKEEIQNIQSSLDKSKELMIKNEFHSQKNIYFFENEEDRPYWDKDDIKIINIDKLNQIENYIEKIVLFTQNKDLFLKDKRNEYLKEALKDVFQVERFLIYEAYNGDFSEVRNLLIKYNTLKKYVPTIDINELDFEKIDFEKIDKILSFDEANTNINLFQKKVNEERKNQSTFGRTLERLKKSRNDLQERYDEWKRETGNNNTKCPYCGYDWKSEDDYLSSIKETEEILKQGMDENTNLIEENLAKIRKIYEEKYSEKINEFIEKYKYYENPNIIKVLSNIENDRVKYLQFSKVMKKLNIDINKNSILLNEYDQKHYELDNIIEAWRSKLIVKLPEEYVKVAEEDDFNVVFINVYKRNYSKIQFISDEKLKMKKKYLEYLYFSSEKGRIEVEGKKLNIKKKYLDKLNHIQDKIGGILSIYNKNIVVYQGELIGKIRIPLYLYSGRILQNYPEGLGIFIQAKDNENNENTEEELQTIRFSAPLKKDHDILYTLSSGQLSGVIIALTITLNKLYTDERFQCLLIDDPVQTMDELNIASLVELLRSEFSKYQIILSTHEDDFSRYIRYKFKKNGLAVQRYTMKED